MKTFVSQFIAVCIVFFFNICFLNAQKNVLIFSKTKGFRHFSIEAGKLAFQKMAKEKGFNVQFSEDASVFTTDNLKKLSAVVFLNTTGDILNAEQQLAFEHFIQAGGGYVGIHSATDTEYEWHWYGQLSGAYFLDHPGPENVLNGRFNVVKRNWATEMMPDQFEYKEEFYSFKHFSHDLNVVLTIDEKSYKGGKNGDYHPMSWYHEFNGGRSFYTALGHTNESFNDPMFLGHLWAGLNYAMGGNVPKPLDYSKIRPEENRFTKVVLAEGLDEPMELCVLDEHRIIFIQRKGQVRLYDLRTKTLKTIAEIPVSTLYNKNKDGKQNDAEDGLLGLTKDPNFAQNSWIYIYYSPEGSQPKNVIARFELKGDELVLASKKVILEVPVQRDECCHAAGSLAWDKEGNLYLSTGDNTNPFASDGYSPSDERLGRSNWDAQRSSANTNDLRGKIIRIKPQTDGSYTIPNGNLFAKGTPQTRPEIYTMGHRNPFRISIDPKNGYLYWGDVGPDANDPQEGRGPAGYDEIGQARKAGNFGWPHFVADNKAYHHFNFQDGIGGSKWLPEKPINDSPNNTGLKELPPAQKAFIWYPYGKSEEFLMVGSGGRNAMAGPVFYADQFKNAPNAFSPYYDKKLFIYDWIRGWIMAVTMTEEGNFRYMEPFVPHLKFNNPMDMEFAPNGNLYMLEYGTGWFSANDDARLFRIEYNKSNRNPKIEMNASKKASAVPLITTLSAKGTLDYDGDAINYVWTVTDSKRKSKTYKGETVDLKFKKPGNYIVGLVATDSRGGRSEQTMDLKVGNEAPNVKIGIKGNQTFFSPNKPLKYAIKASDKEDELSGGINPEQIVVNIDYLPEGYDKVAIAQGHRLSDVVSSGLRSIESSDCKSCHSTSKKSIGPSYLDIAKKYKDDNKAVDYLSKKIIAGGSGVWGETPMAGHPQLSASETTAMAKYILSLGDENQSKILPEGEYVTELPQGDKGKGIYLIRAAYQDKGSPQNPTSLASESMLQLRNAEIHPYNFDIYEGGEKSSYNGMEFFGVRHGTYVALKEIDMTDVRRIEIIATALKPAMNAVGGKIIVRLDNPQGKIIGEAQIDVSTSFGDAQKKLSIPISPITTKHDVYFTFENPQGGNSTLMIVHKVVFQVGEESKTPVLTKKLLAEYKGRYKMEGLPFEFIEISEKQGKLWASGGGQEGFLIPLAKPDRFDAQGVAILEFIRDAANAVDKIKVEAEGEVFEGEKIK